MKNNIYISDLYYTNESLYFLPNSTYITSIKEEI